MRIRQNTIFASRKGGLRCPRWSPAQVVGVCLPLLSGRQRGETHQTTKLALCQEPSCGLFSPPCDGVGSHSPTQDPCSVSTKNWEAPSGDRHSLLDVAVPEGALSHQNAPTTPPPATETQERVAITNHVPVRAGRPAQWGHKLLLRQLVGQQPHC